MNFFVSDCRILLVERNYLRHNFCKLLQIQMQTKYALFLCHLHSLLLIFILKIASCINTRMSKGPKWPLGHSSVKFRLNSNCNSTLRKPTSLADRSKFIYNWLNMRGSNLSSEENLDLPSFGTPHMAHSNFSLAQEFHSVGAKPSRGNIQYSILLSARSWFEVGLWILDESKMRMCHNYSFPMKIKFKHHNCN